MISLYEWKQIGILLFILFFVALIIQAILYEIAMKIKNKAKKRKSKSIRCNKVKNDFKIDYEQFIIANFGINTYLYENKNRKAELMRIIG